MNTEGCGGLKEWAGLNMRYCSVGIPYHPVLMSPGLTNNNNNRQQNIYTIPPQQQLYSPSSIPHSKIFSNMAPISQELPTNQTWRNRWEEEQEQEQEDDDERGGISPAVG